MKLRKDVRDRIVIDMHQRGKTDEAIMEVALLESVEQIAPILQAHNIPSIDDYSDDAGIEHAMRAYLNMHEGRMDFEGLASFLGVPFQRLQDIYAGRVRRGRNLPTA